MLIELYIPNLPLTIQYTEKLWWWVRGKTCWHMWSPRAWIYHRCLTEGHCAWLRETISLFWTGLLVWVNVIAFLGHIKDLNISNWSSLFMSSKCSKDATTITWKVGRLIKIDSEFKRVWFVGGGGGIHLKRDFYSEQPEGHHGGDFSALHGTCTRKTRL